MPILAILPARYASSRFPGKLLQKVGGKTVLQRTWEQTNRSQVADTLIATDSLAIADHVTSFGGKVLWTSPTCRSGTERILEALQKEEVLQKSSILVNVQGDHPCIDPKTIDLVIEALQKDPQAVLATAATPIEKEEDFLSPHVVKVVFTEDLRALYFSRAPIPYQKTFQKGYAHVGIYAYRTSFLLEQSSLEPTFLQEREDLEQLGVLEKGFSITIALVQEGVLGVDIPSDLAKLESFLCKNLSLSPEESSPLSARG